MAGELVIPLLPCRDLDESIGFCLGDAKGDDVAALRIVESGLARYPDAPAAALVSALLYKSELAVRMDDRTTAVAALGAAKAVDLTARERTALAADIAHAVELVAGDALLDSPG